LAREVSPAWIAEALARRARTPMPGKRAWVLPVNSGCILDVVGQPVGGHPARDAKEDTANEQRAAQDAEGSISHAF